MDITLIAVSGSQLNYHDLLIPYALRATYGLVEPIAEWQHDSYGKPQVCNVKHLRSEKVEKRSGAKISQMPFLDKSYSVVSGAIFDLKGIGNIRDRLGENLVYGAE